MKRTVYLAVGSAVLVGAIWFAWAVWRDNRLQSDFGKIAPGTTELEVAQKFGRPKRIEKCGEFFGPLPKVESDGCIKEYLYASPFAPLLPQYYVVRFGADNRVKSTSPYLSP